MFNRHFFFCLWTLFYTVTLLEYSWISIVFNEKICFKNIIIKTYVQAQTREWNAFQRNKITEKFVLNNQFYLL